MSNDSPGLRCPSQSGTPHQSVDGQRDCRRNEGSWHRDQDFATACISAAQKGGFQPYRFRYWLTEVPDPQRDEKICEGCTLYLSAVERARQGERAISLDELTPTGCGYDFPTSSEGKFPHIVDSEKKRQYTPHRNRNIGLFQKGGACHGSSILRSPSESSTSDDSASPTSHAPNWPRPQACHKAGSTHGKNA